MQQPGATPPQRALDTRPLETRSDPAAVQQYRAVMSTSTRVDPRDTVAQRVVSVLQVAPALVVMVIALFFASAVLGNNRETLARGEIPWVAIIAGGFLLIVAAGCAWAFIARIIRVTIDPRPWERWTRLDAFAHANGMTFTPFRAGTWEKGIIFGAASDLSTHDVMQLGDGWLAGRVETARLRRVTRSDDGKNETVVEWSYVVIQLDRALPNMVLDATQNDRRMLGQRVASNLPASFDRSQRLSLEGDFDRWFTLYAPKQYERDALYVFTPDLMALLIDQAGQAGSAFDVEIVDDRMYLYTSTVLDPLQPAMWQRLAQIVQTVGAKTLRQTTRYADERVGDRSQNVVAPGGRRLKRSISVFTIIVLVGFAALWVLTELFGK